MFISVIRVRLSLIRFANNKQCSSSMDEIVYAACFFDSSGKLCIKLSCAGELSALVASHELNTSCKCLRRLLSVRISHLQYFAGVSLERKESIKRKLYIVLRKNHLSIVSFLLLMACFWKNNIGSIRITQFVEQPFNMQYEFFFSR